MDGDAKVRARIMEHWQASEQGDSVAEHAIMEFSGGLVAHETQYFADPFDPAEWRAALAEKMPGRS